MAFTMAHMIFEKVMAASEFKRSEASEKTSSPKKKAPNVDVRLPLQYSSVFAFNQKIFLNSNLEIL